jgi:glycerol-3-phosphate acyltransferase PlsX
MSESRPVTVAVDAVGGDFAPEVVLQGVALALAREGEFCVALIGPAEVVVPFADAQPERVVAVITTQIIEMSEHPATAARSKKDSSIVVGCRMVREGEADAFFSAGNTGAAMAAATLVMGRIPGVARPAIATVLPTAGNPTVMLDVGANADCKAENLVQFGHMGAAYASAVLHRHDPRVALLNIGEEPSKGSQLAQEAFTLLAEQVPGFMGNVEGRDVLTGAMDVIVTDGFTGNVALKLLEGTSRVLMQQVREAMLSSAVNKIAAAVVAPSLRSLAARLDPDLYGGAPLLGVNGVCIIGHGSSGATAVSNAIGAAVSAVEGRLTERIASAVGG